MNARWPCGPDGNDALLNLASTLENTQGREREAVVAPYRKLARRVSDPG